ncbi:hypothetical protein TcWFU_007727 [Taenia crassiceps]|uniref:Uncharacterized protein n=1 Tax=Taenia crassiceps TaxID=6207 RepID=A0ABR4QA49_9CEST
MGSSQVRLRLITEALLPALQRIISDGDCKMCLLLVVLMNLHCIQCLTTDHEVYGLIGSAFHVETVLPVDYQMLVTDAGRFPISKSGRCSTQFFECQITKDDVKGRMLTLKGTMNEHLNYIYLFSDEGFVPTTIYFFNNGSWSEAAPVLINPAYSTPIVHHRVPKNMTVKLTCFIKKWYGWFQLFTTVQKELYFSTTNLGYEWVNYTSHYPHILKVAYSNNDEGKVIDVEVTSNGSIDHYTCNYGDDWLTHVIHWEEPMTTTTTKAFATTITTTTATTTEAIITAESESASRVGKDAAPMPLTQGSSQHPRESSTKMTVETSVRRIKDNSGLHLGEIIGIVIGIVCTIAFFTTCSLLAWRRTRKSAGSKRRDDEGWKSESKPNQPTTV